MLLARKEFASRLLPSQISRAERAPKTQGPCTSANNAKSSFPTEKQMLTILQAARLREMIQGESGRVNAGLKAATRMGLTSGPTEAASVAMLHAPALLLLWLLLLDTSKAKLLWEATGLKGRCMGIEAPRRLELPSWHAWVELPCPISLHCTGYHISSTPSGLSQS